MNSHHYSVDRISDLKWKIFEIFLWSLMTNTLVIRWLCWQYTSLWFSSLNILSCQCSEWSWSWYHVWPELSGHWSHHTHGQGRSRGGRQHCTQHCHGWTIRDDKWIVGSSVRWSCSDQQTWSYWTNKSWNNWSDLLTLILTNSTHHHHGQLDHKTLMKLFTLKATTSFEL